MAAHVRYPFLPLGLLNCSNVGYVTHFYGNAVKLNYFYERLFFELGLINLLRVAVVCHYVYDVILSMAF